MTPLEITNARKAIQERYQIGAGAAQAWCAKRVGVTDRAWRQWESGHRRMRVGLWGLFRGKFKRAMRSKK